MGFTALLPSGKWIASDWPVCPIAEMACPRRMGAALTYASRYVLFTLVGIAGEDDLDAPDLGDAASSPPPSASAASRGTRPRNGQPRRQRVPAATAPLPLPVVDGEQSAVLRERLQKALGPRALGRKRATSLPSRYWIQQADPSPKNGQ
jgi:hypothetical protein